MGKDKKHNIKESINEVNSSSENINNISKEKKPLYIGYKTRVFIYTVIFVAALFLATFVINVSFSIKNPQAITYQENGNLDYKVYLKDNEFYEEEYLTKDKTEKAPVFVASLIKKIDITYNYIFKIGAKSNINFNYDIIGTLTIADSNNENVFFEKDYTLLENTNSNITHGTFNSINKTVSIDYDYYNNLANKFRANYGVSTTSNLIVKLKVKEKSIDDKLNLNKKSEMSITIPLSEREIDIDYQDVNNNEQIISDGGIIINNYYYIALGIILLIISIIFMIKLFILLVKNINRKPKYDKYIRKILREYDRLIVNTTTAPNTEDKKIVEVNSFEELLDVRDNLKLPIKYYVVTEHQKCNFYITHDEEIYLLTISSYEINKSGK